MKFTSANLDLAENMDDAGYEGRLGLRGLLDPKPD
jgi:hypothetical protein